MATLPSSSGMNMTDEDSLALVARRPTRRIPRERQEAAKEEQQRLADPSVQDEIEQFTTGSRRGGVSNFLDRVGVDEELFDSLEFDRITDLHGIRDHVRRWMRNSKLWGWLLGKVIKSADKNRLNMLITSLPYTRLRVGIEELAPHTARCVVQALLAVVFLLTFLVNPEQLAGEQAFLNGNFQLICFLVHFVFHVQEFDVLDQRVRELLRLPISPPVQQKVDVPVQWRNYLYLGHLPHHHTPMARLLITLSVSLTHILIALSISFRTNNEYAGCASLVTLQSLWAVIHYHSRFQEIPSVFAGHQAFLTVVLGVLSYLVGTSMSNFMVGLLTIAPVPCVIAAGVALMRDHKQSVSNVSTHQEIISSSPSTDALMTISQAEQVEMQRENARFQYNTCFDHTPAAPLHDALIAIACHAVVLCSLMVFSGNGISPLVHLLSALPFMHVLHLVGQRKLWFATRKDMVIMLLNQWTVMWMIPDLLNLLPFDGYLQFVLVHGLYTFLVGLTLPVTVIGMPLFYVLSITYHQFRKADWFILMDDDTIVRVRATDQSRRRVTHEATTLSANHPEAPSHEAFHESRRRRECQQSRQELHSKSITDLFPSDTLPNHGWAGVYTINPETPYTLGCVVINERNFYRCADVELARVWPPRRTEQRAWVHVPENELPWNFVTTMDAVLHEDRNTLSYGRTREEQMQFWWDFLLVQRVWVVVQAYHWISKWIGLRITLTSVLCVGVLILACYTLWQPLLRTIRGGGANATAPLVYSITAEHTSDPTAVMEPVSSSLQLSESPQSEISADVSTPVRTRENLPVYSPSLSVTPQCGSFNADTDLYDDAAITETIATSPVTQTGSTSLPPTPNERDDKEEIDTAPSCTNGMQSD